MEIEVSINEQQRTEPQMDITITSKYGFTKPLIKGGMMVRLTLFSCPKTVNAEESTRTSTGNKAH